MFGVLCGGVYSFLEKRVKSKGLLTLYYFLMVGGIWALVMSVVGLLMTAEDLIKGELNNPYFYIYPPVVGFVLGDIFAFFPWLIELRNARDHKTET